MNHTNFENIKSSEKKLTNYLGNPSKKLEIPHLGEGGPDRVIFHTFFFKKKKNIKIKLCLKCILSHFKPF